jgi:hypothetical protein
MCKRARERGADTARDCFAIVVSNTLSQIAWFEQAIADPPGSPVCWDYHVLYAQRNPATGEFFVFDHDSTLPFPCPAREYFRRCARPLLLAATPFLASYRLLTADAMLRCFASDRRHMRLPRDAATAENGGYSMPPPLYAPIATAESTFTLDVLLDMSRIAHTAPSATITAAAAATAASDGSADAAGAESGSESASAAAVEPSAAPSETTSAIAVTRTTAAPAAATAVPAAAVTVCVDVAAALPTPEELLADASRDFGVTVDWRTLFRLFRCCDE